MRQTGPGIWPKLFTPSGSKCSRQLYRCTRLIALRWLLLPENCCSILTPSSNLLKRLRLYIDECSRHADFVCSWNILRNYTRNSNLHKVMPAIRLHMGLTTKLWFYASVNELARFRAAQNLRSLGRVRERRGTSTKKISSISLLFRSKRKKKSGLTTQME